MDSSLLAIYMNDQLAAGVVWKELARRSAKNNEKNEAGPVIAGVADEIAEDVETFTAIMARLGIRKSPVKPRLAVFAERVGRLKMNGRVVSYSPLSRFTEHRCARHGSRGQEDPVGEPPGFGRSG